MSMFLLVTIMTILMVALVRVIVVVGVVSRRNLREVVEVAAYGKSAILGIWAAYGSFRLYLTRPLSLRSTPSFSKYFHLNPLIRLASRSCLSSFPGNLRVLLVLWSAGQFAIIVMRLNKALNGWLVG